MFPPVEEVAKSYIQDGIECPYPLIPIYDKIVQNPDNDQRIPKAFHFAWLKEYSAPNGQGRCISPDMMEVPQKWMEHFPSYNVYFHDDESVDTLFAQHWPEFPAINKFMKSCVMYGNAMKIDIWRQLLMYRYGGIYVDLDMLPGPEFTEKSIQAGDSAVFVKDGWGRPSQWFMAMEQKSPIAYFTLLEIMKRLLEQGNVFNVRLVFVTGPDALKFGYSKSLARDEEYSTVFNKGLHNSTYSTGPFRMLPGKNHAFGLDEGEHVPYPRNHMSNDDYVNVTKKERAQREMKGVHWQKLIKQTNKKVKRGGSSCQGNLFFNDLNTTQIVGT